MERGEAACPPTGSPTTPASAAAAAARAPSAETDATSRGTSAHASSRRDLSAATSGSAIRISDSVVQWNGHKAGLAAADAAHVQATVERMSRGSRFYANEERKRAQLERRASALRRRAEHFRALLPAEARAAGQRRMDAELVQPLLRAARARDAGRVVVHLDMDQFFAAVALLDRPELRGKPYAVGDLSMIATSSYEARKYGVRSGMPGFIGRELCPQLVFVPAEFARYAEVSARVHAALRAYDPACEMASLDEAYLDLTPTLRARDISPEATTTTSTTTAAADHHEAGGVLGVLREVRDAVRRATGGLTCSAGAACNALLAKIATDLNKPDGQSYIAPDAASVEAFLRGLPVRKVPGIGRVTERMLHALGIATCDDIVRERLLLSRLFKEKTFTFLLQVGLGIDKRNNCAQQDDDDDDDGGGDDGDDGDADDHGEASRARRKGISRERTFSRGVSETAALRDKCTKVCALLWRDIERRRLRGRCVGIKLKRSDFVNLSRAISLSRAVSNETELVEHAWALLRRELPIELRLLGVRLSALDDTRGGGGGGGHDGGGVVHAQARLEDFWRCTSAGRATATAAASVVAVECGEGEGGLAPVGEADVMDDADGGGDGEERHAQSPAVDRDSRRPRPLLSSLSTSAEASSSPRQQQRPYCREMRCPVCHAFQTPYLSAMDAHVEQCLHRAPDSVSSSTTTRTLHRYLAK